MTALGAIGSPEAMPALLPILEDHHALLRASAANALGKIADPEAIYPLQRALSDPDPAVKWNAASALGRIADTDTLPLLTPLLQDRTEVFGVSIAEAARCAIDNIKHREANPRHDVADVHQGQVLEHSE